MQEVWVQKNSRILIWPGVHVEAAENMRVLCPSMRKAFIVADKDCSPIVKRVALSLEMLKMGVSGCLLALATPEKGPGTLARIRERLARFGADASCAVVGVGSACTLGVAGAAARETAGGLPLFMIPTTVDAQGDAAVGGNCAPCPAEGRSAAIPWNTPIAVFDDPSLLETLPLRRYLAGLAEAVKCGVIHDTELFEILEKRGVELRDRSMKLLEEVVFRCASVKSEFIGQDAKNPAPRRCLDYGHTVGRALERVAGNAILHGEALAVGMEAESFMAQELGIAGKDVLGAQNKLLKSCGLPTRARGVPPQSLVDSMQREGEDAAPFALPVALGQVRYPVQVPRDLIARAIAHVTR